MQEVLKNTMENKTATGARTVALNCLGIFTSFSNVFHPSKTNRPLPDVRADTSNWSSGPMANQTSHYFIQTHMRRK
jgi:hypothetical protein